MCWPCSLRREPRLNSRLDCPRDTIDCAEGLHVGSSPVCETCCVSHSMRCCEQSQFIAAPLGAWATLLLDQLKKINVEKVVVCVPQLHTTDCSDHVRHVLRGLHQGVVLSLSVPRREALSVEKARREVAQHLNRCRAAFVQSTWLFCLSFFLKICRSQ